MKLSEYKAMPADLGLVNSQGFFGNLIRPAQGLKYGEVDATHAFMFPGATYIPPSVIEQLWLMKLNPVTHYDGKQVKVWRNKKWTDIQKIQIATKMLSLVRKPYPIPNLFLNLGDLSATWINRNVFKKKEPVFWFTSTFKITSFTECMQAYAWAAYKVIGTDDIFGCPWRCIDPEGADCWCESQPDDWELTFKEIAA